MLNRKKLLDTIHKNAEKKVQSDIEDRLKNGTPLSSTEIIHLCHELQVHKIELEMQKEELVESQEELNEAKLRYFNLYNLAPVGYCSLDDEGIILEANLTASSLFGVAKHDLIKMPITHFILSCSQDDYYLFQKKFSQEQENPYFCELQMSKIDGTSFWAHLSVSSSLNDLNSSFSRLIITDITIAKKREEELKILPILIS